MKKYRLLFVLIIVWTSLFVELCPADSQRHPLAGRRGTGQGTTYENGVVAADHPAASSAGVEILKAGGNVVDAAVATSFALSVVRPSSCGLGGGGFMLIWDADKQHGVAVDYRERAPQAASREMYLDPDDAGQAREKLSRQGELAVAVPGTVAGLCFVLERYGSLDLKTVLAPAIRLARVGVPIDDHDRLVQSTVLLDLAASEPERRRFDTLYREYLNGGRLWRPGDRFHSPQREVLEIIAAEGADGFYRGKVAQALVAELRRGGGIITLDDLAQTLPIVRPPLRGRFDRFKVLAMPPPSSGGVALIESLNILTAYESAHPAKRLERLGHNSPEYLHLLTEALKHTFADRAEFLGDADFNPVPVERLISKKYAAKLAGRIDLQHTRPLKSYGRFQPVDDGGTSHFSVIDSRGNAVACTETINTYFGSYVVEPTYGIVLNNEMDDFAAVPGVPNAFGLLQSEANAVGPGHKPLSSMSPTILIVEGRATLAVGASGGPRIISSTLQVLLNATRFGMSPEAAVAQPRMHHQWLPEQLYLEQLLFTQVGIDLQGFGHQVVLKNNLAATQAVSRGKAGLRGASDSRKHGRPDGF